MYVYKLNLKSKRVEYLHYIHILYSYFLRNYSIHQSKASRGARVQCAHVSATGCGFDTYSKKNKNLFKYIYFYFFALVPSASLNSATQYAMRPEFTRHWGREYLNSRFPRDTAGSWLNPLILYEFETIKIRNKIK